MNDFSEFLYQEELIDKSVYQSLLEIKAENKLEAVILYLRDKQCCNKDHLLAKISEYFNIDIYVEDDIKIEAELSQILSLAEVEKYNILALKKEKQILYLGCLYPLSPIFKENLRFKYKSEIKELLMSAADFQSLKEKLFSSYYSIDPAEILKEFSQVERLDSDDIKGLKSLVDDAPVVKLLNNLLNEAISLAASDIHLESKQNSFEIFYRIDGIIKKYYQFPLACAAAVISRIKIISGMDITNKHLPQDGKLEFKFKAENYDIRSSVIPTIYGEKAVLRLLLRNSQLLTVNNLNFSPHNQKRFRELLNYHSGIILLAGPTGSGKTTSLFAILNELSSENLNIITIENPVEYKLPALNQIEINPAQGLSYARALRSILRQDPDIIMIGEIRDKETAEIAVRASVTGHLVLSTVHTIDAVSAVLRLIEMGIPPYLIGSTLNAVVAQRLLRKLCPECKKVERDKNTYPEKLQKKFKAKKIYQAVGCSKCSNSGYKNRTAAAEILFVNEKIRELISSNYSRLKLKQAAKESGMRSLFADAAFKISQGESSIAELLRVINLERS